MPRNVDRFQERSVVDSRLARIDDRRDVLDPRDVQDRNQLNQFLGQSISDEYKTRLPEGEIRQSSTFVKSYLIEHHAEGHNDEWRPVFLDVLERRDKSLLLLFDRQNIPYFADLADERFAILHTIGRTELTDATMDRLTQGNDQPFDRAWLPTDFLYGTRRGPLRGFKFGHQTAVVGVSTPQNSSNGFEETEETDFPSDSSLSPVELHAVPTVGTSVDIGETPISRLIVSNTQTAERDYLLVRDAPIFDGRQSLDSIQFVASDEDRGVLNASIYSKGKIVGSGTSLGLHLLVTNDIRSAYSRKIRKIESDYAVGWLSDRDRLVYRGEPLHFLFPVDLITDLSLFVDSLLRPVKPFRMFGIPHQATQDRIDVEALDLHTGDSLSLEVTKSWMRVYLPQGSCGNIIARLYSNLQRAAHSSVRLVDGNAQLLFAEGDARDQ